MTVISISDKINDYAQSVHESLINDNIRSKLDVRNEKMGAKIRSSELRKIPIMIILGENEKKNKTISVRRRFEGNIGEVSLEDYIIKIKDEINNKDRRDSK